MKTRATQSDTVPGVYVGVPRVPVSKSEMASKLKAGFLLTRFRTMTGIDRLALVKPPEQAKPVIQIVEKYQLSSFLGTYGAGRTVSTFSLLPGEETTISIKSYRKSETDRKETSSILDSVTQASADEFQDSLTREQSDKQNTAESSEWHVEGSADCSWGFGNAKVSAGGGGNSSSSREEFARDVSSVASKHAAKASAKRDFEINTSYSEKVVAGTESSIVRKLKNINKSRTLNFVFRQMNQEFITILHLVDVRIGFWNGFDKLRREAALPEIDSFLKEYLKPGKVQEVKKAIEAELKSVYDYEGKCKEMVETVERGSSSYWRVPKTTSAYEDKATNTRIAVPGIIMSAQKITMRTDGLIVEALLGRGEALEEVEVAKNKAEALEKQAQADRAALLNQIVKDKDKDQADLLAKLTSAAPAPAAPIQVDVHSEPETGVSPGNA